MAMGQIAAAEQLAPTEQPGQLGLLKLQQIDYLVQTGCLGRIDCSARTDCSVLADYSVVTDCSARTGCLEKMGCGGSRVDQLADCSVGYLAWLTGAPVGSTDR